MHRVHTSSDITSSTKHVSLVDILDRVLNKGVVIAGDITISVADIDLVYIDLRVLITAIESIEDLRLGNYKNTENMEIA